MPSDSSQQTVDVLQVEGMTCGNCAQRVQAALASLHGVDYCQVDLAAGTVTIHWKDPSLRSSPQDLVQRLVAAGYPARAIPSTPAEPPDTTVPHGAPPPSQSPWFAPLILGVPVATLLLAADWGWHLGTERWFQWIAFILALPVQAWIGGRFYKGAWSQLRVGRSNMDTLVSLGSTAAFGFSTVALFTGWSGHLYFAEAVTILTLISLGHWLEDRMASRAADALRSLARLRPDTARRLRPDASTESVPVARLEPGDTIRIQPGDRIPVDARILSGEASLDEAMLTGESRPVDKRTGDRLYAGTTSRDGILTAEVLAVGQATALARIIQAVERAQSSRAQVQRLVDRVSSIFVPVVILLALAAALFWALAPVAARSLHNHAARTLWRGDVPEDPLAAAVVIATAVLIVACPCAMGLATPVALMAGVNRAARRGILIRDAIALEKSGRITTLVFDKTGTLTAGKPSVAAWILPESPHPSDASPPFPEILRGIVRCLTQPSQHPLSSALYQWTSPVAPAHPTPPPPASWREIRGQGVLACFDSHPSSPAATASVSPAGMLWRLGSLPWMQSSGIDVATLDPFLKSQAAQGASVLVLADSKKWQAAFALRDSPRPEARQVLHGLRQRGLGVRLLTGDLADTAQAVGRELGLVPHEISAGVPPESKAAELARLQAEGLRVAFVGDGINDAPALARADLGVAVVQATDVARDAADILLLRPDLGAVVEALDIAQATLRTIHQNLFWAFFYNAAAIPLAAIGLLSPIVCALTMGLSDLIVVGNALRLRAKHFAPPAGQPSPPTSRGGGPDS